MTMERSSTIMDAIFASPEEESRGRLLKIIQEFLTSEASKHSAKEKGSCYRFPVRLACLHPAENAKGKVNMDELVGNTDGFADSGCVDFLGFRPFLVQNSVLLQCEFGYRAAVSESNIGRCAVPVSTNSSNGNRCAELYNQAGLGSPTAG